LSWEFPRRKPGEQPIFGGEQKVLYRVQDFLVTISGAHGYFSIGGEMRPQLPVVLVFGSMPEIGLNVSSEFGTSELERRPRPETEEEVFEALNSCGERLAGIYMPMKISQWIREEVVRSVAHQIGVRIYYYEE